MIGRVVLALASLRSRLTGRPAAVRVRDTAASEGWLAGPVVLVAGPPRRFVVEVQNNTDRIGSVTWRAWVDRIGPAGEAGVGELLWEGGGELVDVLPTEARTIELVDLATLGGPGRYGVRLAINGQAPR